MKFFKGKLSPFEKVKQDYLDDYRDCSDDSRFKIQITFDNKRQLSYQNNKQHVAWLLACFSQKIRAGFSYHEEHCSDVIIDFSKVTDILVEKIDEEDETPAEDD